jgi:hypothetical protein
MRGGRSEIHLNCGVLIMAQGAGVSVIDGWAFGIVIVIGGQFIGWNEGLEAGYGSFLIGTLSVGIAFFGLVLCLAEIGSALPFPGNFFMII